MLEPFGPARSCSIVPFFLVDLGYRIHMRWRCSKCDVREFGRLLLLAGLSGAAMVSNKKDEKWKWVYSMWWKWAREKVHPQSRIWAWDNKINIKHWYELAGYARFAVRVFFLTFFPFLAVVSGWFFGFICVGWVWVKLIRFCEYVLSGLKCDFEKTPWLTTRCEISWQSGQIGFNEEL